MSSLLVPPQKIVPSKRARLYLIKLGTGFIIRYSYSLGIGPWIKTGPRMSDCDNQLLAISGSLHSCHQVQLRQVSSQQLQCRFQRHSSIYLSLYLYIYIHIYICININGPLKSVCNPAGGSVYSCCRLAKQRESTMVVRYEEAKVLKVRQLPPFDFHLLK